jgi:hypothetical protein
LIETIMSPRRNPAVAAGESFSTSLISAPPWANDARCCAVRSARVTPTNARRTGAAAHQVRNHLAHQVAGHREADRLPALHRGRVHADHLARRLSSGPPLLPGLICALVCR